MPSTSLTHHLLLAAVFVIAPLTQACTAPPPESRVAPIVDPNPGPNPRTPPSAAMQRLIVQYGEGNADAHERRILDALQGVPHTVLNRMPAARTVIVQTNRQGLERLRGLPGITVHSDGVSVPHN